MHNRVLASQTFEKLIDLNDLRVFAYVASLASFSLAADALRLHKSSVSRSIARLELALETPLLERTTRKVRLTRRGIALNERCVDILSRIDETIGYVGNVDVEPIGFFPVRLDSEVVSAKQFRGPLSALIHHRGTEAGRKMR